MSEYDLDLDQVEEAVAHKAAVDYPRTRISDSLERIVELFGRTSSFVWVILILLIVGNVVLRYALGTNFVALEELQWHLYAVGFMLALSYCITHDGHVRVDVAAERMSPKARAWIEILGIALFILPFCTLILIYAWPFVEHSMRIGEVSAAPGGLPLRWLIKSVILLAFGLMFLAATARLFRALAFACGWPRPLGTPEQNNNHSPK
ncbi:TRAP transporter small permease subunit [Marinobacterium sp. AK62]|uniref:TRAP transporter small permease protein n=1 Tax=Marinobacterium alkalitolerans TaxID=1542925 RepID=A0ABS3Z7A0_9GAMM|nr:TRAP transporter small permease subunit [Marinobacterium alkalitolerans]MBP0047587.1 TRAP transporter small permease subunit [Marinobacterium alkalitolerans]